MARPLPLLAAALALAAVAAEAQPLRRDLDAYFIFALRTARLKNLSLDNGCNIGVDCASPGGNSQCGNLSFDAVTLADGSQAAGDLVSCGSPGSSVYQLFRNGGGLCAGLTVRQPPASPFATPIIPGTCDAACNPDVPALEALCGFPDPFPACNGSQPVTALPGQDCAGDTAPGNGRCDLAPGAYGTVNVRNKAKLQLAPGAYTMCLLKVGRNGLVVGDDSTIRIPAPGYLRVGGQSSFGQQCGDLTVHVQGPPGRVQFGRGASIAAEVCAPGGKVRLGHGNTLLGRFVGDTVSADRGNHGRCCGPRCACVETFEPATAPVGAAVTLRGLCHLDAIERVTVCGIEAPIVTQAPTEVVVTVPAGAGGPCDVAVESKPGTFVMASKLAVP